MFNKKTSQSPQMLRALEHSTATSAAVVYDDDIVAKHLYWKQIDTILSGYTFR